MFMTPTSALALSIAARAEGRNGGIKQIAEGRSDVHKVNPFKIEVEPGFNVRDFESPEVAEHIDNLAISIAEVGVKRALTVRNKGGKLILKDGECRLRAVIRAIEVYGAEIVTIPVILADRSESDADATLGILVENSGLAVTPLGKAMVVKRLLDFGWSQKEIAARAGMSKARVIQLLDIVGLSTEVKGLINDGTISATTALSVARDTDFDDKETVKRIKDAGAKVAANGKSRVTARSLTSGPSLKDALGSIFADAGVENIEHAEGDSVSLTISAADWAVVQNLLKLS